MSFRKALQAVLALKDDGVISDYAIGGATALVFWSEPVATYDLDVFVILSPASGPLISLAPVYEWAASRGYTAEQEHIIVAGVPVQLIPAHDDLAEEAIVTAATMPYGELAVRVIRPEYLIALYLEPSERSRKRLERVAALLESGIIDQSRLDALLVKYGLSMPKELH